MVRNEEVRAAFCAFDLRWLREQDVKSVVRAKQVEAHAVARAKRTCTFTCKELLIDGTTCGQVYDTARQLITHWKIVLKSD